MNPSRLQLVVWIDVGPKRQNLQYHASVRAYQPECDCWPVPFVVNELNDRHRSSCLRCAHLRAATASMFAQCGTDGGRPTARAHTCLHALVATINASSIHSFIMLYAAQSSHRAPFTDLIDIFRRAQAAQRPPSAECRAAIVPRRRRTGGRRRHHHGMLTHHQLYATFHHRRLSGQRRLCQRHAPCVHVEALVNKGQRTGARR